MEKIYSEHQEKCRLTKASVETVQFLLDYSNSLHIIEHKALKFESILN